MGDDHDESSRADFDLSDAEREALHELQLGLEHVYRGYGALLTFHHQIGHAMDHVAEAEVRLRAAGHEQWADELRDHLLPAGAVDDLWKYELVEAVSDGFLRDVTDFEADVRDGLADGVGHVTERRQQARWRKRAGWEE